jgi:predicted Zn-dependent protease with MMP-like domain
VIFTREQFEDLVAQALDAIPEALGQAMDNVVVQVQARHPAGLLGLYHGVPLTNRDNYGIGMTTPDRITLFQDAIVAMCATPEEVVDQVRITVVHEVAHHFGIDDDRLEELGYG